MDAARCALDGQVYTAFVFEQLPPAELEQKRRFLVCSECGAHAFFRKASRHGHAACFGARPHEAGCGLAAADSQVAHGGGEDQDELINPGERIVVDLNYGAVPAQAPGADGGGGGRGRGGRYVGDGGRPPAAMHRRLSSLLRTLRDAEQFRQSTQVLEVAGHGEFVVRDFFVRFENVRPGHARTFKGFWGMLTDARADDGSLWLNSGGRNDISICVEAGQVEQLLRRCGVEELEELAGAYVLVIGEMRVSAGGKMYVLVSDIGYVSVRLT